MQQFSESLLCCAPDSGVKSKESVHEASTYPVSEPAEREGSDYRRHRQLPMNPTLHSYLTPFELVQNQQRKFRKENSSAQFPTSMADVVAVANSGGARKSAEDA